MGTWVQHFIHIARAFFQIYLSLKTDVAATVEENIAHMSILFYTQRLFHAADLVAEILNSDSLFFLPVLSCNLNVPGQL